MIRRLSTKESLEYLKENGCEIPERTYFDHKKKLKEFKEERLINVIEDRLWKHFQLLDTLELFQGDLWKELEQANDVNLKLKIQNAIKDNQILISKCYDAISPTIESQIESYRAIEISDNLTYAGYQKVVAENSKIVLENNKVELKNRISDLNEKLNDPYIDLLAIPGLVEDGETERRRIKKEIEKTEQELEKLAPQEAAEQKKSLPILPKNGLNPKKEEGG